MLVQVAASKFPDANSIEPTQDKQWNFNSVSYQVLARKWRPTTFSNMVGQEHVVQALVNALDSDRLHHAYLFCGTRGVGKTTVARIFAKSLNCETGVGSEPCGQCASCQEIDQGRSVDLIEIDAASRTGVDDMRELLDNVQYAPTHGRFKVYLIDEVHMLSKHSFNALLKTLEEPPGHVKFLLATTDPQKMPVTVLSRCLQFNLKRMSRMQIQSHLQFIAEQESVSGEAAALGMLASAADGSMRDALSLMDQALAFGGGKIELAAVQDMLGSVSRDYLLNLLHALLQQDGQQLMQQARSVIDHSPDFQRVCAELISLMQFMALAQAGIEVEQEEGIDAEVLQQFCEQWTAEEIQLFYQILLQGREDLLIAPDEAAAFEMLMLRLLAFSPETSPQTDQKKKPEPATGDVANKREKPAEVKAPVETAAVPSKISAPPSLASPEEPARVEPIEEQPASEPEISASGDFDWSMLAYQISLEGLAREIAVNSAIRSRQGNKLEMVLPRTLFDLTDNALQSQIGDALNQSLGVSYQLRFLADDDSQLETPMQAKERRYQADREAAIAAIRSTELVKTLGQRFGAELDESTVQPLNTPHN